MTIAPRDERENPVLHANPDTNHKRAQATMIDEKPPGKQSMATERTFDSADNLLGSEQDNNEKRPILPMNEVLPSTVASTIASPQPFTCRTFWDVRAIQWPPRHPLDSLECAWKYFQSPFHATEVAVLGTFLLLCYKLPGIFKSNILWSLLISIIAIADITSSLQPQILLSKLTTAQFLTKRLTAVVR